MLGVGLNIGIEPMEALNETIKDLEGTVLFHRKKARAYLIMLWILAFFLLFGGLLFGGLMLQLIETLVIAVVNGPTTPNNPVEVPDLTKIALENNLGYFMLSGFFFVLLIVVGLMRHHIKRIVVAEDRLFYIRKISVLYSEDSGLHAEAIKSLAQSSENETNGLLVNPGYELLEKSIKALSHNIDTLVNKITK